jgi:hypothetical protein
MGNCCKPVGTTKEIRKGVTLRQGSGPFFEVGNSVEVLLENGQSTIFQGRNNESITVDPSNVLNITIEKLDNSKLTFNFQASEKVQTVRQKAIEGFTEGSEVYYLIYHGKILDESSTLAQNNVLNGSTIDLIPI